MTIRQMRLALYEAYEGKKWAERVKKMSDEQVFATYTRIKNSGRI